MEKSSKPNFLAALAQREIPLKYKEILEGFYTSYCVAVAESSQSKEERETLFISYLDAICRQCEEPFPFQPYHERIRAPFDYYAFGVAFMQPLVDLSKSSLVGKEHLLTAVKSCEKGDNVIFLANHQIEGDPQAISVMLQESAPDFAEKMIFVAGERVLTDPLAVPFSMGRNLLCIYSKRYIDHPPELRVKKQLHNQRSMERLSELLSEGGKVIYVAPSGGRDRPNPQGIVEVADFDARSIEMLYLTAQRAGHPTHFHTLALKTYDLLPPPETIQIELGEARRTKRAGIHMYFGPEIAMEHFPGNENKDKQMRRAARAKHICSLVRKDYATLP
ncbi:MAG: 1-acyl-sn-glycerol-3-phosphate acyltransferase [Verrucomicrobia bacterium]|nr:1-acyl-sn-glycerol-3-phosphate acyltransferase [Verrucomicrobiota bacterium]